MNKLAIERKNGLLVHHFPSMPHVTATIDLPPDRRLGVALKRAREIHAVDNTPVLFCAAGCRVVGILRDGKITHHKNTGGPYAKLP